MVLNAKFVIKSTTKISLNERFTELQKIKPTAPTPSSAPKTSPLVRRPPPPPRYEVRPISARPRFDQPYHPALALRPSSESELDYEDDRLYRPAGRYPSLAERIANGYYVPSKRGRPMYNPVAMKLRRRSVQQRIGGYPPPWNRGRGNTNSWRSPRFRRGFFSGGGRGGGFRRSRSFQNLKRWNSSTSLNGDGGFRRRSYSSSGNFRREEVSRDTLDKELDEYMAGSQTVIDAV